MESAAAPAYRHTQAGHVVRVCLFVALAVCALSGLAAPPVGYSGIILFAVCVVLALAILLFWSMTVEIRAGLLEARLGPGLIRKRAALDQIASCEPVRNPWWYGWGIHYTPHGWLYNVSGARAVEIRLRSGKVFRLGTDEPEVLASAVRRAIGPQAPQAAPARPRPAPPGVS
jgi:hypothetical protein